MKMGTPNRLLPYCQPSQEMHGEHQSACAWTDSGHACVGPTQCHGTGAQLAAPCLLPYGT
jgi:hypothetical protein